MEQLEIQAIRLTVVTEGGFEKINHPVVCVSQTEADRLMRYCRTSWRLAR